MTSIKSVLALTVFLCGIVATHALAAVGGGFTACGLKGEYFANPDLTAPAAFVRQDNRLAFDWGDKAPIGGSNTPALRTFPHDHFSVRWSGKVVPRFTENYTFTVDATSAVQVWVNGNIIIDRVANGAAIDSKPVSLIAGTSYDFKVEVRQGTGTAKMILKWASASTPQEVIDPLSVSGFNLTNCSAALFADDAKYCLAEEHAGEPHLWFNPGNVRDTGIALSDLDSELWPKKDAVMWVNPYVANGTYRIQFNGKADVSCSLRWFGREATFSVDNKQYTPTLPSGVGYDPATNTTTALMTPPHTDSGLETYAVSFANTQRDQNAAQHSGITNLHIMRPQSQTSGAEPCAPGTIVYPSAKAVLQNYVVYRYFGDAFADERTWSERTRPGMPCFAGGPPARANWANKCCWEYLIMLANETGKDLYISISARADHDYYTKLANLVKYGSDGVNPYTSASQWPAAGPVYPPLNPNLHFYIEYSNEVWNFGFGQFGMCVDDEKAAIANKTEDGQVVNYDGNGIDYGRRWQALQTVRISDAFRSVFGDAAMGDRIRVLMFDQYGMYGNSLCQFIDNYFNKADPKSTYTAAPHPVHYYIWGGGGAIYYGSNHSDGVDPDVQFANAGFETPALATGGSQVNPAASGWDFTGNAGICRNIARRQAVAEPALGAAAVPTQKGWVGFKFTVGAKPIYVYDVARLVASGNERTHAINIFKADGSSFLANEIKTTGAAASKYVWTRVIEQGWTRNLQIPLKLDANTTYYLMSHEDTDACYAQASGTPSPGITINCPVTSPDSGWKPVEGAAGNAVIGPVNFTFTDTPEGDFGFICDAPEGSQAAFIGDTGAISQTVNFTKTGTFAIGFNCAIKPGNENQVEITVDGVKCTPLGGIDPMYQAGGPWNPGGFERRADDLAIRWGSTVFPITQTGNHVIQIKGVGKPGTYIFFDDLKILSTDAIYGPNCDYFPSMGEANGQDPRGGLDTYVNTLHGEVNWTAAWGLKTMAYEGGWSCGGDFDQKPIHAYCKYVCPQTIVADAKAIDVYTSGGGSLFCYYYSQWPDRDVDNAASYPLVKAVIQRNDRLPKEANFGTLVPANLAPGKCTITSSANADSSGSLSAQGAWISWNIIVPATQNYRLTSMFAGTSASSLLVDDNSSISTTAAAADATKLTQQALTLKLTKGQHTVKVRNDGSQAISVKNIEVVMPDAPAAPTLLSANFGDGSCALKWSPVPEAAGYKLYYGTTTGSYTSSTTVGNVTEASIPALDNSKVYYIAVQAVNASNLLSLTSNEIRVAHRSANPQALIDFKDQKVDGATTMHNLTLQGYKFTAFGDDSLFYVAGPEPQSKWIKFPTHVLYTHSWGCDIRIERADFKPFDLYSLDLCSIYGGTSIIITGYDPSSSSFRRIVNLPDKKEAFVVPVTLDWANVTKVEIHWSEKPDGGGSQGRAGGVDNLLFNKQATAPGN